jgi:hypothetical protein
LRQFAIHKREEMNRKSLWFVAVVLACLLLTPVAQPAVSD